jgi:transcriptional regulator with XRE-family HTH domain
MTNRPRRGRKRKEGGPHPIDIHVGARVRSRRIAVGMSQERLAATLGVTFQQLQKYEGAANRISASRLFRIGQALDVPVVFFFEGPRADTNPALTNTPAPPDAEAAETDPLCRRDAMELIAAYSAIADANLRRQVLELARLMAGLIGATGPPR